MGGGTKKGENSTSNRKLSTCDLLRAGSNDLKKILMITNCGDVKSSNTAEDLKEGARSPLTSEKIIRDDHVKVVTPIDLCDSQNAAPLIFKAKAPSRKSCQKECRWGSCRGSGEGEKKKEFRVVELILDHK